MKGTEQTCQDGKVAIILAAARNYVSSIPNSDFKKAEEIKKRDIAGKV